jgi:hypothetical protein
VSVLIRWLDDLLVGLLTHVDVSYRVFDSMAVGERPVCTRRQLVYCRSSLSPRFRNLEFHLLQTSGKVNHEVGQEVDAWHEICIIASPLAKLQCDCALPTSPSQCFRVGMTIFSVFLVAWSRVKGRLE